MARSWAGILSDAIADRGTNPSALAKATARFPGGPLQRMTIGRQARGEAEPTAKSLRLLCAALNLSETEVRAEIAWAPLQGDVFEGGEESRTLTARQREAVSRVITEMTESNRRLAAHGLDPEGAPLRAGPARPTKGESARHS